MKKIDNIKAIKELNLTYLKLTGGTITGDLFIDGNVSLSSGSKNFIAQNNYGYMGKDTNGTNQYLLYLNSANEVNVGYNNRMIKLDCDNPKQRGGHRLYHEGFKPSVSDIGAAPSSHEHNYIPTSASCNKNWQWSGQSGQPTWLWGGNDSTNQYIYNPSNFNVKYATSAGVVPKLEFTNSGTCTIESGGADAAAMDRYNLKIKSWYGIGFPSYDNINRIVFDTRNGNMTTNGTMFSGGGFKAYSGLELQSINSYTVVKAATDLFLRGGYSSEPDGIVFDSGGYFRPVAAGSRIEAGSSNRPWLSMYAVTWNTVSDKNKKMNIEYINKSTKTFNNETNLKYYNFIKDKMNLATYRYKDMVYKNRERDLNDMLPNSDLTKIGFIAQDLIGDDVGELILSNLSDYAKEDDFCRETLLTYDMASYVGVVAQALKESINEIENLKLEIKNIKDLK